MKPEDRNSWRREDHEFQQEFQDVSEVFQKVATNVATVPADLDRHIKELASSQVAEELNDHWLLGGIPQLSMAVSLMFAIGVLFVVSLDRYETESRLVLTDGQGAPEFAPLQQEGERAEQLRKSVPERANRGAPREQFTNEPAAESAGYAAMSAEPVALTSAAGGDYHLLERADPVYPQPALEQGIAGWVLIEFNLSMEGKVEEPVVVEACGMAVNSSVDQSCSEYGNPIFNDAALQAVRQFRYKPGYAEGRAVVVEGVRYRVRFLLPESKQTLEQDR